MNKYGMIRLDEIKPGEWIANPLSLLTDEEDEDWKKWSIESVSRFLGYAEQVGAQHLVDYRSFEEMGTDEIVLYFNFPSQTSINRFLGLCADTPDTTGSEDEETFHGRVSKRELAKHTKPYDQAFPPGALLDEATRRVTAAKIDRKRGVKLYWVSSPDHDEDWFIFSKTERQARHFHDEYEGYGGIEGMIAEPIMHVKNPEDLPSNPEGTFPCHAQLEDLVQLGFVIGAGEHQRMVMLGERIFTEGGLEAQINVVRDHILEAEGKGRPNGTVRTISDEELEERYRNYEENNRQFYEALKTKKPGE